MKNKNFTFNSDSIKKVQHNLLHLSRISSDENNDIHPSTPLNPSSINQFNVVDESCASCIEFLENNDSSHTLQANFIIIYSTEQLFPLSTSTKQSKCNDWEIIIVNDADATFTNKEI